MSEFDFPKAFKAASDELRRRELRRLFDAYIDPRHEFWGLVNVLSSVQKSYASSDDWKQIVIDVMQAMELHDAGQFPDEWFDEIEGGAE